jgi:transcriptional regulator of met regulon
LHKKSPQVKKIVGSMIKKVLKGLNCYNERPHVEGT